MNGGLCIKYRQSRSCCPHYGELGPFILLRFAHNKKSSDLWSICAVNSRHILCDENILIILFLSHMPLFDRFWSVCKCGISTSTTISVAVGLFFTEMLNVSRQHVWMEKLWRKWLQSGIAQSTKEIDGRGQTILISFLLLSFYVLWQFFCCRLWHLFLCLAKKSTNEKNMDLLSNQTNLDFLVITRPPFITCHLST